MRLGYLGPPGTYTEAAAEKLVTQLRVRDVESSPVDGIPDLLDQLRLGSFDGVVAPLKNTLAGEYHETAAGITRNDLVIVGETLLKIELAIGIHPSSTAAQVSEVWSKDTALRECSHYLASRFPGAKQVEVPSTGFAMKQIAEEGLLHVAAVGSQMGLRRYGLTELAHAIENPGENVTTFVFLKRKEGGDGLNTEAGAPSSGRP